jgi:hypothetical protein
MAIRMEVPIRLPLVMARVEQYLVSNGMATAKLRQKPTPMTDMK